MNSTTKTYNQTWTVLIHSNPSEQKANSTQTWPVVQGDCKLGYNAGKQLGSVPCPAGCLAYNKHIGGIAY